MLKVEVEARERSCESKREEREKEKKTERKENGTLRIAEIRRCIEDLDTYSVGYTVIYPHKICSEGSVRNK